jgi:hypothetical protein
MTYSKTVTLTIAGVEGEVTADFSYYPGRAAVMYLRNGDPGYPEEPDEIELESLWMGTGKGRIDVYNYLTVDQIEAIEEAILEEGMDEFEPEGE